MEWVHCRSALEPVAPDQYVKEIPAPLSAIVMKLRAKTAEEVRLKVRTNRRVKVLSGREHWPVRS
jgi:hypothetical protein